MRTTQNFAGRCTKKKCMCGIPRLGHSKKVVFSRINMEREGTRVKICIIWKELLIQAVVFAEGHRCKFDIDELATALL